MSQRFDVASRGSGQVELCPAVAPPRPDLLSVLVSEPRPGVLVIAPTGEVDLSTVTVLRDAAFDAVDSTPAHVVVDLSGLTFCGSTGLVVLMDTQRRAVRSGVSFCTAGAGRSVRRVLEITGLRGVLGHHDSLAEALSGRCA